MGELFLEITKLIKKIKIKKCNEKNIFLKEIKIKIKNYFKWDSNSWLAEESYLPGHLIQIHQKLKND